MRAQTNEWHASYSSDEGLHAVRSIVGSLPDKVAKALVQPFTGLAQRAEKLPCLSPDERSVEIQEILQRTKEELSGMERSAESIHQQLQSASDKCGAFWDKSNTIRGGLVDQLNDVTVKATESETNLQGLQGEATQTEHEIQDNTRSREVLEREIGSLRSEISDYEKMHSVMTGPTWFYIPMSARFLDAALYRNKRDLLHAKEDELNGRKNRVAGELQSRLNHQRSLLQEMTTIQTVLDAMTRLKGPVGELKVQFEGLQEQLGQLQYNIMTAKDLQASVFINAEAEGEAAMIQLIVEVAKAAVAAAKMMRQ